MNGHLPARRLGRGLEGRGLGLCLELGVAERVVSGFPVGLCGIQATRRTLSSRPLDLLGSAAGLLLCIILPSLPLCLTLGPKSVFGYHLPELRLKILKRLHFKECNWLKRPLSVVPLLQAHAALTASLHFVSAPPVTRVVLPSLLLLRLLLFNTEESPLLESLSGTSQL